MPARFPVILFCAILATVAASPAKHELTPADQPKADPMCGKFRRTDRAWCALQRVKIEGRNGSTEIGPGACFDRHEAWFFGTNVAADLNRRCPD